ncbi:TLD-domain-containing protein [Fomes fomentarius]|nr:TLD-domain-containing protein [Fomes fomentarius]
MNAATTSVQVAQTTLPNSLGKGEDKEDIFATLFSPPTPRASPTQTPEPESTSSRPARHARTESTDSDFGAFVSVPATEDPLRLGDVTEPAPFTPLQNYEFFDRFTEDAKAASERRRKEMLDELQHEDDPLYWLQGTSSNTFRPSQDAFATSQPISFGDSLIDLDSPSDANPSRPLSHAATYPDLSALEHSGRSTPRSVPTTSELSDMLIDIDTPLEDSESERLSRRQRVQTSPQHSPAAHLRSPSLPPSSPTRLSTPEIQRTQSSYFTPTALPTRWVSNFLSNTIRAPRAGPSASPTDISAASIFASHAEDPTLTSSRFSSSPFSRSAPHSRAATVSEGAPIDAAITHGTPFASHPYVPSSGAPGFAGDRQWNKGFEFDKTQVERKSVKLTGRKEVTVPVLTVELADMLRPFFPALARLPKTWSLLYSLDQHGISLNTLYGRCQDSKRSALLIVRDAHDSIFGAWIGEGIHPSKGAYYGSGESFLWKMVGKDRVRVFKWTGKNDYVALCEPDYISFGGGDGLYGLWLDDTLMDGSSAKCLTFDNDPLCSQSARTGETVRFECVGLEVWGIG